MNARAIALFFGALFTAGQAAGDISYDYAEAGYAMISVDVAAPLDGDGDGPGVLVSHEIYGPFFGFGGYDYTDFSDDNVSFDNLVLGLGAHHALGEDTSGFVSLSYLRTEVENVFRTFDQDGYGVTVGIRVENRTPWEFVGTIDYVNVESGVETGAGISLIYDATRRFSVLGGVNYFEESTSGFLGVRYFFDIHH